MNNFSPCKNCENTRGGCKERKDCEQYKIYEETRELIYKKEKRSAVGEIGGGIETTATDKTRLEE